MAKRRCIYTDSAFQYYLACLPAYLSVGTMLCMPCHKTITMGPAVTTATKHGYANNLALWATVGQPQSTGLLIFVGLPNDAKIMIATG